MVLLLIVPKVSIWLPYASMSFSFLPFTPSYSYSHFHPPPLANKCTDFDPWGLVIVLDS